MSFLGTEIFSSDFGELCSESLEISTSIFPHWAFCLLLSLTENLKVFTQFCLSGGGCASFPLASDSTTSHGYV